LSTLAAAIIARQQVSHAPQPSDINLILSVCDGDTGGCIRAISISVIDSLHFLFFLSVATFYS